MRYKGFSFVISLAVCLLAMPAQGQRIMENSAAALWRLGSNRRGNLLSWRLYGTEQGTDVAFNVYKGTTKLNATPITTSTNYLDSAAGGTDYTLKAIVGGVEEATGTKALSLPNGYLEIRSRTQAVGRSILPMSAISTAMANTNTSWTGFRQACPSMSTPTIETGRSCGGSIWAPTARIPTFHSPVRTPLAVGMPTMKPCMTSTATARPSSY